MRPYLLWALLAFLPAGVLPAQESRHSDAASLLDRIAATSNDSSGFGAAMLVEFALLADEPAYSLAAKLWVESLDDAPPARDAAEALMALRDNPALPGPKRFLAARMRRLLLARQGAIDQLEHEIDRGLDGEIRSFVVIGPFGFQAESLAGFPFPPETAVDFEAEHPGYEDPVCWTPYQASPGADSADPFEVLSPRSGAAYALAQLHVREPRALFVALQAETSVELFVDGKRALVIDHRREIVPKLRWVGVSFPAGWHHLLVKTTDSGEGAFRVSVLETDRGPCPVATDDPDAPVSVETRAELHPIAKPAEGIGREGAFAATDLRDAGPPPSGRADRIVAGCVAAWRGLDEAAFAATEGIMSEPGLSTGELWMARSVVDATTHLPDTDKLARMVDLAKRAAAADPEFSPAIAALARNEARNDRAEEALTMLGKAIEAHPKCADLWDAQIEIMGSVGFESDRERAIDAALAACPGCPRLVRHRLDQLEKKGATPLWIAEASAEAARNATAPDLARDLAENLLAARRFDDLATHLSRLRALHPHDVDLELLEAASRREQGDAEGERAIFARMIDEHPRDTRAIERLAQNLMARDPKDQRVPALLALALKRDPDLHAIRRLLRALAPPERDYFEEFRVDAKAFLASAPGPDAYPDSRIVLLLDQVVLWIHDDGTAEQEIHQLHRLQDPRGKDDLGTVSSEGEAKIVQTILPDGRTLVPNPGGHGGFEMAGLAPGVVVERRFRRSLDRASGRPESFGGFYFQDTRLTQPYHDTRYVVIVPKKLGLEPVVERFPAGVRKDDRGDVVVYEFRMERVPRIQREVMMPRPEDIVPHVEFRRPDAWARINRRYLDVYEAAWRPTPPIEDAARKAAGDATAPVERARRIYDFVMDTVTSNEGTGWPTETLLEKSGDRFPLYLAMLRAAGVPHRLAMGRAQEKVSPPIRWDMVSDDIFEIPLVRIDAPGAAPVYVSTQLRFVPFGELRHDLTDAPVFVAGEDGGRIERTPPAPLHAAKSSNVEVVLKLDAAGVAEGTVSLELPGWTGAFLKEQIERTEKKRLEQWAQGAVLGPIGRFAPKPRGPVRFKNAASRTLPLVIEVDVEMKQLVRRTDGGATIEAPFAPSSLARKFVDRKERKLPFVFHQYYVEDARAVIDLDPSWKVGDLPGDFERSGPLGTVVLKRSLDGTKLVLRREIAILPAEVPAAEFPAIASFAKDVDQAEAQKITLRRETQ